MRRVLTATVVLSAWLALTAADARAQSSNQLAAARELVESLQLGPTMQAGATTMIELQVKQNPLLAPYRQVMLDWATKYLTAEAVLPEFAEIYAQTFTERELRELTAFYRTSTGQKLVAQQPELTRQGAAVGQKIATAHQAELEVMISARASELGQPSPGKAQ
jgi:hypothetical protein